jgi:hypothetical protein
MAPETGSRARSVVIAIFVVAFAAMLSIVDATTFGAPTAPGSATRDR